MNILEFNPNVINEHGLGLLATNTDDRNKEHPISALLPKKLIKINSKYWPANGWWGDQGQTPRCVAYSTVQWMEDSPITHSGKAPCYDPDFLYSEVQAVDEWAPMPHDGSSTLAAMKILQAKGYIKSYYWGYSLSDLVDTVLTLSACLVGTNWYEQMFYPTNRGIIKLGGDIAGGHQWIINGVNKKEKMFRGKTSWGIDFSPKKNFYISFADMERLIDEHGEIALASETKLLK